MRLIRLSEDNYILDPEQDLSPALADELSTHWQRWWETKAPIPKVLILGGVRHVLRYEDRREPDIEKRLKRIERRLRALEQPHD